MRIRYGTLTSSILSLFYENAINKRSHNVMKGYNKEMKGIHNNNDHVTVSIEIYH